MSRWLLALLFAFGSVTFITGCEEKPADDATDAVEDAVEEGTDAVEEGTDAVEDAVEDATGE